ncbi:hypothetical protein FNV43_RR11115 [Rhamnella rubrinervis]|uniref:Uncharacterized protein n=1 Tax=Rhamnella rubrinervis TaxID=2594499 RepID=A0A8K0H5D5_9ROSA|nr:hypothetical protein FNV43_RR11115 [Rhamnella rubrinervis]
MFEVFSSKLAVIEFRHNPSKQQAMDNILAHLDFGSSQATTANTNDEEDSEEDPTEANDSEGSEDSIDYVEHEVQWDLEDFDLWDDLDND